MLRFWRNLSNQHVTKTRSHRQRARRLQLESLDSRRVLASAYQNPGQVFDVNNDTYVDQEDVRLSEVRLKTVGEGQLPATRDHHLIPFYDVNGDGAFTKRDLTELQAKIQQGKGTISIKLANDSGNKLDRTTNDVRIVGRVMGYENGDRVFSRFGEGRWGWVEITNLVRRDGTFELSIHDLHRINGRLLPDSQQALYAQSMDRFGRVKDTVDYSFTIDRTAPIAFNLDARVFESPIGTAPSTWVVRWNQNDARSYDLTVTSDAAGKNVVRYEHDLHQIHANRFVMDGLGEGTYYVWLTGFDRSGNRTLATGNGQRVDWKPTFNPARAPIMEPANFGSQTGYDGTIQPTWNIRWTPHTNEITSYKVIVARDQAGTDIAYEYTPWQSVRFADGQTQYTNYVPTFGASLSHLASGAYYLFVKEFRSTGAVNICDGVEVNWNPERPGAFEVDEPGFVLGNSFTADWEDAANAVRYEAYLYRTDIVRNFVTGVFIPPGITREETFGSYHYGLSFVSKHDTTLSELPLDNLAEGNYHLDVIAYDAQGRRVFSSNEPYFTVDYDGLVQSDVATAFRFSDWPEGQISISAYAAIGGVESVRYQFYSSADLTPESLIQESVSDQTFMLVNLQDYAAYDKVYVKVTYLDRGGDPISLAEPIVFDPDQFGAPPASHFVEVKPFHLPPIFHS